MKTAFGLDLAGFSSGASALVELAETNSDELVATVREDSSWRAETEGAADLGDLRSRIHKEIAACMPLAVDVPLDLNPIVSLLPADDAAPNHCFDMAWQHTLRP